MKKEKIPYIRFKKFEQNWFMICLNKISKSIEYGLNASAKDFDGIHKYLRITDIDDASRLFLTDKLSSPDINFTVGDYENYKFIQGSRIRSNDYRKRYEYRSESSGKQLHHQ